MNDFLSFFDFAMDMVCLMPPLDKVTAIFLTREQAILIALIAIGILVGAVIAAVTKGIFSNNSAAGVIVAIGITVIGFSGLKEETLRGIFLALYPPMVIVLRFGEGATIGARTSSYLRWWHGILLLAIIGGLHYILKPFPTDTLVAIKGGWAFFGVLLASFMWTRRLADDPPFNSPFCLIGVFAVFASTLAYVSTSHFERTIYQWALPIGLLIGIVARRISPHAKMTRQ